MKKRKLTNRIIKVRSKKKTKRKIMKGGSLFNCGGRPKRANKDTDDDLPICPITQETVEKKNAVTDIYGHTYNRKSILEWIKKKGTSPMNRQPLQNSDLQKGYTNKNAPPKPEPEPEPEREREPEPEPEPTPVAEFREGESVLYESSTHGVQIPCTVGQVNDNGTLWLVRNIGGQIKTVQVQADPRFVVLNHAPAQARLSTVAEDGGYPTGGSDGSAPSPAPAPAPYPAPAPAPYPAPAPAPDWSTQDEELLGELCMAVLRPVDCWPQLTCGVCDANKFRPAERIAAIEAELGPAVSDPQLLSPKGNPHNLPLKERLAMLDAIVRGYIEEKETELGLTSRGGLRLDGRLDAINDKNAEL